MHLKINCIFGEYLDGRCITIGLMDVNQIKADLQWTLTSTNLLTDCYEFPKVLMHSDVRVPENDASITPNRKVGHYFEQLVSQLLTNSPGNTILHRNLQIHDQLRTVGELDFVFQNDAGLTIHLETAAKFYLYYPDAPVNGSHFLGPNSADTFEIKCNRLFHHQLTLGDRYYQEVQSTMALVKGMIFYPLHSSLPERLPEQLNVTHQRGAWLFESQLESLLTHNNSEYAICRKPHWLAPPVSSTSYVSSQFIYRHLRRHFADRGHPVMISRRQLDCNETQRLFVVPNHWPNQTPTK
tara:strand:+ start:3531 stop:4418 length:888 start_codon:yes stop_codon:yes gene_type:complete